jgi:hypothetical protein
MTIWI